MREKERQMPQHVVAYVAYVVYVGYPHVELQLRALPGSKLPLQAGNRTL